MQIDQSNIHIAVDLLMRGMPGTKRQFWEKGLARMQASEAHRARGEDIGQLVYAKGEPVGIGLTAVSYKPEHSTGKLRRTVNLASWYFEPAHRFRLPFMLNKSLRCSNTVFTDLTPTRSVWPILEALDFVPLNQGVHAISVPAAAIYYARSHTVLDWAKTSTSDFPDSLVNTFKEHEAYGCLPFVIETPDARVPALVKPCRVKGIPSAQLIYCTDNHVLDQAIGGLSRKLVRHGVLMLLVDIKNDTGPGRSPVSMPIKTRRRRFIKNGEQNNRTDYTYSELVFFDF